MTPIGTTDESGGTVGEPGGAALYLDFFRVLVSSQDERKESIERRGIAVVSTSGVLVTVVFGAVSLFTSADGYELPNQANGPIGVALGLFVAALLVALLTNLPLAYPNVNAKGLDQIMTEEWGQALPMAQRSLAGLLERQFVGAQRKNDCKAWLLVGAMFLQLCALISLALGAREILVA